MRLKNVTLATRLNLIAAAILLVGTGASSCIYLTADQTADSMMINNFLNSKKYIHDLHTYGGNTTVLADRFLRWFNELWHGEALAYTVGGITLTMAFVFFLVAHHLQAGTKSVARCDNKHG